MAGSHRPPRRLGSTAALVLAPLVAVGTLTAMALAAPRKGPVAAAAFRFAEPVAADLAAAGWWGGERRAALLGRDATRRDLVRLLAGLSGLATGPIGNAWTDVAADDVDGQAARQAVRERLVLLQGGAMALDQPVSARAAQRAVLLSLGLSKPLLAMSRLSDASGRRLRTPPGFAPAVVAREAGLRHNYPAPDDGLERADAVPMRLADLLHMFGRAREIGQTGPPESVRALTSFRIPAVDPSVLPLVERALSQVGNPYVWGGEWPGTASPFDTQAAGGFDCSGLVWFSYRAGPEAKQAGLRIPVGRTTYTMVEDKRGRNVPVAAAQAADLVFFGDRGPRTSVGGTSHMAMALGGGWIVQSSGSRAGVTVSSLAAYWPSGIRSARTYRPGTAPAAPPAPTPTTTAPAPTATAPAPVTTAPAVTAPLPAAPPVAEPGAPPAPVVPPTDTAPVPEPPPG